MVVILKYFSLSYFLLAWAPCLILFWWSWRWWWWYILFSFVHYVYKLQTATDLILYTKTLIRVSSQVNFNFSSWGRQARKEDVLVCLYIASLLPLQWAYLHLCTICRDKPRNITLHYMFTQRCTSYRQTVDALILHSTPLNLSLSLQKKNRRGGKTRCFSIRYFFLFYCIDSLLPSLLHFFTLRMAYNVPTHSSVSFVFSISFNSTDIIWSCFVI